MNRSLKRAVAPIVAALLLQFAFVAGPAAAAAGDLAADVMVPDQYPAQVATGTISTTWGMAVRSSTGSTCRRLAGPTLRRVTSRLR